MALSQAMQAQFDSVHHRLDTMGNELTGIRLALEAVQRGEVVSARDADPRRVVAESVQDVTEFADRVVRAENLATSDVAFSESVHGSTEPIEHRLRRAVHDVAEVIYGFRQHKPHVAEEVMIRWENEIVLVLLELTGR